MPEHLSYEPGDVEARQHLLDQGWHATTHEHDIAQALRPYRAECATHRVRSAHVVEILYRWDAETGDYSEIFACDDEDGIPAARHFVKII